MLLTSQHRQVFSYHRIGSSQNKTHVFVRVLGLTAAIRRFLIDLGERGKDEAGCPDGQLIPCVRMHGKSFHVYVVS